MPLSITTVVDLKSTLQLSKRAEGCPGEIVALDCIANGTSLTWIVEPVIQEENALSFTGTNTPGDSIVNIPQAVRVLISKEPLFSRMFLEASPDLINITRVICRTTGGINQSLPFSVAGNIIVFLCVRVVYFLYIIW